MEPVGNIDTQPWMEAADTRAVMSALADPNREGPAALFVGGCVRDTLIVRDVVDVDIATVHGPNEVMRRLDVAGIGYHAPGLEHGTVAAHGEGRSFEITTLRVDVETDGRHATVAYTDNWQTDAARRDFTMNALYLDTDGSLFDPLGGLEDVKARRVRFIGDAGERIREDALRILRFYRFHAQLDVPDLDAVGLAACRAHAGMLDDLSGERIREEIFKLLLAPGAMWILEGDAYPALFKWLFPELPNLKGSCGLTALAVAERAGDRPDALRRLLCLIEAFPYRTPDDISRMKADALEIVDRLRLSVQQSRRVMAMLDRPRHLEPNWPIEEDLPFDHASALLPVPRMLAWRRRMKREKQADRGYRAWLYRLDDVAWRDTVLLNWADQFARMMMNQDGVPARVDSEDRWLQLLALPAREQRPLFPLRGSDVIALGVDAGPDVGRLLGEVESWWIEGGLDADRNACLAELRRRVNG